MNIQKKIYAFWLWLTACVCVLFVKWDVGYQNFQKYSFLMPSPNVVYVIENSTNLLKLEIASNNKSKTETRTGGHKPKAIEPSCDNVYDKLTDKNLDFLPRRLVQNVFPPSNFFKCGQDDLMSPVIKKLEGDVWMLFIVKSAPDNFNKRDTIRRTWATVSQIGDKKFSQIFLLGRPTTTEQQRVLAVENKIFGDILQCDHLDSYHNMSLKMLSSIRWILTRKLQVEHYTFCDDDTVMHIANIYVYFNEQQIRNITDTFSCGFRHNAVEKPIRIKTSKWFMGVDLYDKPKYPTFCHGGMWTTSRQILQQIYCVATVTNVTKFYLDDVLLTGILRRKALISDKRIHPTSLIPGKLVQVMYLANTWDSKMPIILQMHSKWTKYYKGYLDGTRKNLLRESKIRVKKRDVKYRSFNEKQAQMIDDKWKEYLTSNKKYKITIIEKHKTPK